jgi:hypothetical protein
MEEEIRRVEVGEEFLKCPVCGFNWGFHTFFLKDAGKYRIIYIYPQRGARYDVGLKVEL